MRRTAESQDSLTLSYLDLLSCALGATLLLYLVLNASASSTSGATTGASVGTTSEIALLDIFVGRETDLPTCETFVREQVASRVDWPEDPGAAATDNATQRCAAFQTAADQADCMRRVQSSPASGSVSGGGVLRESTTTTITVPAQQ